MFGYASFAEVTGLSATAFVGDGTATAGGFALVWALVDTTQHP